MCLTEQHLTEKGYHFNFCISHYYINLSIEQMKAHSNISN